MYNKLKSETMDDQELNCVIKEPYYNHFIHLISFGSIWLVASIIGVNHYENLAIVFLFAGTCLFTPLFNLARSAFSLCPMKYDDPLRTITTCMTIAAPIGMVLCFLPFMNNINAFFSVFGVLFGLVFIVVAFLYNLKKYYLMGGLFVIGEIVILTIFDDFSLGGFFAAGVLISFGIMTKFFGDVKIHQTKKSLAQS